jgi:hypothetical protein
MRRLLAMRKRELAKSFRLSRQRACDSDTKVAMMTSAQLCGYAKPVTMALDGQQRKRRRPK